MGTHHPYNFEVASDIVNLEAIPHKLALNMILSSTLVECDFNFSRVLSTINLFKKLRISKYVFDLIDVTHDK